LAILFGLTVGTVQVYVYDTIFDIAFVTQIMPDSLVYAAAVRIGH